MSTGVLEISDDNLQSMLDHANSIGVGLWPDNDPHRLVERAMKYQILFFVLTFCFFYVSEIVRGKPVHPMQYLLVGLSLTLFYLLLLSLGEHLGFGAAYVTATGVIVVMVTGYVSALTRSRVAGRSLGVGLALLYAYLFTTLRNEQYALLAGTVGLTVALAVAMFLTRNVDWYRIGKSDDPIVPAA